MSTPAPLDLDDFVLATEAELALAELDCSGLPSACEQPDLDSYDIILVNSSGGKDSQAMLTYVVWLAGRQSVPRERILVVHCDLGRVEWPGTRDLAQAQAHAYGLRFVAVARDEDLLDQVVTRHQRLRARGDTTTPAWPSSTARYCTSDQKTGQVVKLMTYLAGEHRRRGETGRIRILNCLGIRAAESHSRAKKTPLGADPANWTVTPRPARRATATRPAQQERKGVPNGRREVTRWLPIFDWSHKLVWNTIHRSALPWHPAYDLGMARLSCVFCVLAPKQQLVLAAQANQALAQQHLAVERTVGHTIKADLSMAQICAEAQAAGPVTLPAPRRRPVALPSPPCSGATARLSEPLSSKTHDPGLPAQSNWSPVPGVKS